MSQPEATSDQAISPEVVAYEAGYDEGFEDGYDRGFDAAMAQMLADVRLKLDLRRKIARSRVTPAKKAAS